MSTTHRIVLACITTFISRSIADSMCSYDFYGVLEGVPHILPEHFLLPHPDDWTVIVPPVCRGEYISGMEARVCTLFRKPTIRISNWRTALVHLFSNQLMYTSVNVTVYCKPYVVSTTVLPTSPPVVITTTPTTTSTTTTEHTELAPKIIASVQIQPNGFDESAETPSIERTRTHPFHLDETRRQPKSRKFYRHRHPFSRM